MKQNPGQQSDKEKRCNKKRHEVNPGGNWEKKKPKKGEKKGWGGTHDLMKGKTRGQERKKKRGWGGQDTGGGGEKTTGDKTKTVCGKKG